MLLSARKQFPSWLKTAGFDASSTIIESRIASIDELIENESLEFWLDITKLYLGVRVSGTNINSFVEAFSAEDDTFPLTDNQNLLRHLASATIAIFLNEPKFDITKQVALSITTTTFLGQYDTSEFPYVISYAKSNLQVESAYIRNNDLEEAETRIIALEGNYEEPDDDSAADFRNSEMKDILYILRNTIVANKALKEEINVHWWLYGEYMSSIETAFKKVDVERMVFLSSLELSLQTVFPLPLRNSRQYLRKAILSAKNGNRLSNINIYNAIQKLSIDDKTKLSEGAFDKIDYQTPILLAIKCSMDVPGEDWSIHFKATSNQAEIKKDLPCEDVAEQLYRELNLLKYD